MKRTVVKSCIVAMAALVLLSLGATTHAKTLTGNLEIFSWWAGDEGPALEALIELYGVRHLKVKVINATVTGGSGVNAKAVLKTRMLGGQPPDSFQVHAGQELIGTWVKADRMEDLTFLFKEEGWMDAFPQGLIKLIGTAEGIWSVPVNIHRSNVTWYNKAVFEANGVSVPTTFDEFFAAAETLEAAGVTPLALGDNGIWAATHLFENVLLGTLGPDGYRGLWTGETDWNGPEVTEALDNFAAMMGYGLYRQEFGEVLLNSTLL